MRAFSVTARPMVSGMRPPARYSSASVFGASLKVERTSPASLRISPFVVSTTTTSPVFSFVTSARIGSAPESCAVAKKIGAMTPPMMTPPRFLFGTNGMSSPMAHCTLLQADLREDPVPTTSPTNATWKPWARNSAILARPPGKRVLPIASAWSGMSGRVDASPAGEKSSVLISPSTLKTFTLICAGTPARFVNHSAFAQESTTFFAAAFFFASATTSSRAP